MEVITQTPLFIFPGDLLLPFVRRIPIPPKDPFDNHPEFCLDPLSCDRSQRFISQNHPVSPAHSLFHTFQRLFSRLCNYIHLHSASGLIRNGHSNPSSFKSVEEVGFTEMLAIRETHDLLYFIS